MKFLTALFYLFTVVNSTNTCENTPTPNNCISFTVGQGPGCAWMCNYCASNLGPNYYFTDNVAGGKRTCWPKNCPSDQQEYGSMCYDKCPSGFEMRSAGLCTVGAPYDRGGGTKSGIYTKKRIAEYSDRSN
jgi:hypothetical protein